MSKVLSCYWNVSINGKELDVDKRICIENIEINEQCDGSDTCTLTLNDPNFLFIEDNIFIEEATIQVTLGWNEDTYRIKFNGYISAIDISFPESGYPLLSIFCLDNSHLMNRKKKKRSWDNVTSADVIKKIAKEYGFKCVIEKGYKFTKEDTISQSNATDIEFCESLAGNERDPFMCKLIGSTLYYVKKGLLKEETSNLKYRKFPYDIISFNPRINKETRQEEITKADINTNDKSVDKSTANSKNTARDTQGESVKTTSTPAKDYTFNTESRDWEVK